MNTLQWIQDRTGTLVARWYPIAADPIPVAAVAADPIPVAAVPAALFPIATAALFPTAAPPATGRGLAALLVTAPAWLLGVRP